MKKILLFTLVSGLLAAGPMRAFNPQPDPPGFGFIGVTPGETLRLNVSNITAAGPRNSPPDPCKVELTFVDAAGVELLPAVQTTLAPGESTSVDLNGADLFTGVTGVDAVSVLSRVEVRPMIRILSNSSTDARASLLPPGPCVSTIELIDNQTGRTFLTSGPQKPGSIFEFNPQPDPPGDLTFGLVGIVPGETIRLTAVNSSADNPQIFPPDPCRVTLTFFNAEGHVVQRSSTVLNPGQSTFLDLPLSPVGVNPAAAVAGPPSQLQLRGIVTVEPVKGQRFPPDPCHATLEVFDQATGRTTAVLSPQRVPLIPPGPPD